MSEHWYPHEQHTKTPAPEGATAFPKPVESPDARAVVVAYLALRGLDPEIAATNGWYATQDAGDDHLRVLIPATNTKGYAYWQARAVDPDVEKRYRSPHYAVGDSVVLVYPTGGIPRRVVIVEGPMDALAAAGCGCLGLAVMGKQPDAAVYDHIISLVRGKGVVIVPDSDGFIGAVGIQAELAKRGVFAEIRLAGEKDLAALSDHYRRLVLGEDKGPEKT